MNTLTRSLAGAAAIGALALSPVTPAMARGGHGDGIGAGEVIAGALVIGGIAAVAAAASDRDRDRYGDDYGYDRAGYRDMPQGRVEGWGQPRRAIDQCVRVAEREAGRRGLGGADVTDIRSVRDTNYGYRVQGRIAVRTDGRGWQADDRAHANGWRRDDRGWNGRTRGYDGGSFDCRVSRGRVVDIDFSGIRGL